MGLPKPSMKKLMKNETHYQIEVNEENRSVVEPFKPLPTLDKLFFVLVSVFPHRHNKKPIVDVILYQR